jgi:transcriptional regulator with XRE-family HTH domain
MAVPDEVVRERLTAVFARQDFYEACRRRDAGAMIRILGAHGITQGQMGARTGLAQSTLSNYKRGKNQAEWASTFDKLANGLDMTLPLRQALGLTGDASPNGSRPAASAAGGIQADTFDLQLLAEAIGRNGASVQRCDMLALAVQLGATTAVAQSGVWERLACALTDPGAMNEATIREMEARSAGFHHLEEIVSAPVLLKGLTVHLREASTLLHGSAGDAGSDLRRRLIVAAGESSVLAGWLASDIGDSATARNFYDTAVTAAKQADDPAIAACALAYRSYIPSTKGASGRARILLTEALENIPETGSPATVAWIAARHAEESAQLGDNTQALASWRRAEDAFSICDPDEDRAWTRFLDQNRFDSYRIATYSKIGRLDEAQEIAAAVLGRLTQPDRKKAVIIFEDIAMAHLARGSVSEAARIAQQGLAVLRETEFAMWLPKFGALAQGLNRWQRQPQVRSYLEEFAMTNASLRCPRVNQAQSTGYRPS